MRFCAPSFSFFEGEVYSFLSSEEAKENKEKIRDKIVVIHPGLDIVLNPSTWANVLSSSFYLVICLKEGEKGLKDFLSSLDRIVFSPLGRTLTGYFLSYNSLDALTVIKSIQKESERKVITIDNTKSEA